MIWHYFYRKWKKIVKIVFFLTGLLTNILRTLLNITLLFIIKNTQIKKIMIKITSDACKNNYALSFWGHMCTLSLCYLFSGLETPRQANSLLFFSFLFLILWDRGFIYLFPRQSAHALKDREKKMIKFCIYYYSKKIRKDKIRTNYDHEDFKILLLKTMSDPMEISKATSTSPALVVS